MDRNGWKEMREKHRARTSMGELECAHCIFEHSIVVFTFIIFYKALQLEVVLTRRTSRHAMVSTQDLSAPNRQRLPGHHLTKQYNGMEWNGMERGNRRSNVENN
uniref:Uncharacterized protein n=1 Tax=Craspedostauros australis TaxID=1486917 RepID=A0A7R9WX29_9STRA|mmetsp:Transcript_22818/g.63665  ORF Transcript_22818/g.63665 Transcript_22818/m.63665 type:complete len:104 (+) Transcript_22818:229-540(+)